MLRPQPSKRSRLRHWAVFNQQIAARGDNIFISAAALRRPGVEIKIIVSEAGLVESFSQ